MRFKGTFTAHGLDLLEKRERCEHAKGNARDLDRCHFKCRLLAFFGEIREESSGAETFWMENGFALCH